EVRVPCGAVVLDGILLRADARQARDRERAVVAAALDARRGGRGAKHAPVLERLEVLRENLGGFRRSEDRRAAHAAGAVVDVPVGVDLAELLARLLSAAEVVLHVGEGAEETFFLAAPECDADRAARLGAGGLEDARGL